MPAQWFPESGKATTEDSEYTEGKNADDNVKRKGIAMPLVYEEDTYKILGACFEVYKEKGCGFLEAVYQECLEIEFEIQQLPFQSRSELQLTYKERILKQKVHSGLHLLWQNHYGNQSSHNFNDEHLAIVHNYMKATGNKVALLLHSSILIFRVFLVFRG